MNAPSPVPRPPKPAARRRPASRTGGAAPRLAPADGDALRRMVVLSHELLAVMIEDGGRKEMLRLCYRLDELLTGLHRKVEPGLYRRSPRPRPWVRPR